MADDPDRSAEQVTVALRNAFGEGLRSVLLYGSTARGEHVSGVSDINLLVLLDALEPARLAAAAPSCRRELESHGVVPLLMSGDDWTRAADAFAVELADMHDAHVVLHGEDPVVDVRIDMNALRLQAEREIRGRIVRLHTAMLLVGDDETRLGALLVAALPAFATYFRAALRLAGRPVPGTMDAVLRAGAELVGADASPLLHVHGARVSGVPLETAADSALMRGFDAAAVLTAAFIDRNPETT